MRAKGYGEEAISYFKACVCYLLSAKSKQGMHDRFRKEFECIWPRDFVQYYRGKLLPRSGTLNWLIGTRGGGGKWGGAQYVIKIGTLLDFLKTPSTPMPLMNVKNLKDTPPTWRFKYCALIIARHRSCKYNFVVVELKKKSRQSFLLWCEIIFDRSMIQTLFSTIKKNSR